MKTVPLRAFAVVVLAWLFVGCGGAPEPSAHVLFIGNSYTSENNLPRSSERWRCTQLYASSSR